LIRPTIPNVARNLAFFLIRSLAVASLAALMACSSGGGTNHVDAGGSDADAAGGHDSGGSGGGGGAGTGGGSGGSTAGADGGGTDTSADGTDGGTDTSADQAQGDADASPDGADADAPAGDADAADTDGPDGSTDGADAPVDGGWHASATVPPASPTSYTCASEIHVATTGDDTAGNGTSAMPYKTIGKGVSMATTAGTCVQVHAGTYAPAAMISFPSDGMSGSPIVLRSADGKLMAVIDGTGATTPVIQVDKDYVVIDGFDFENTPQTGFPVRFDGQYNLKCEGSVLRNSKLSGGFSTLKVYQNSHGVIIENNEIYGQTANSTASLTGASGLIFRSNYVHDLNTGGLGTIELVGGSTGSLFEKNLFQDISSSAGALVFGDDGCGSTCDNDPMHYSAVNAVARSNIFIRVIRAMDIQGCENCSVLANTIIDAGDTYGYVLKIGFATTNGVTQATTGLRILDDLFASPNGVMGYVVNVSSGAGTGLNMDYNLFYNGGNAIQFSGAYPVTSDAHSVRGDPLFVGPMDLHPGTGSPAIGAGTNLVTDVPDDFLNVARPATGPFDIGAIQH
jgi:hypothetical protein